MSRIRIEREHHLSSEESKRIISQLEPLLRDKLGVQSSWQGTTLTLEGKGFTGRAELSDRYLCLEVKLGMLLRPIKGTIQAKVEEKLDEAIANASG